MFLGAWFPLFTCKNLKSVIPGRSFPKRILLGYFTGPVRQKTIICWLNRGSESLARGTCILRFRNDRDYTHVHNIPSRVFKSYYPAEVVDVENLYNNSK